MSITKNINCTKRFVSNPNYFNLDLCQWASNGSRGNPQFKRDPFCILGSPRRCLKEEYLLSLTCSTCHSRQYAFVSTPLCECSALCVHKYPHMYGFLFLCVRRRTEMRKLIMSSSEPQICFNHQNIFIFIFYINIYF